jgi:Ca2+/H+ antiporter, TMEM165/GDT1 family
MSATVVFATFALVAVAELPDKTMIATLLMGSRSRPVFVWIGAMAAFTVHATLAVLAGRLIELLPHRWVELVVTVLFLGGAVYLLVVPERSERDKGEAEAVDKPPDEILDRQGWGSALGVAGSAFGVILIAEFGDLTQLLIINLAAHYHDPPAVFLGAMLAFVCVSAAAAFGGRALLRVAPLGVLRRGGGVLLAGFGAYTLYSLVH